MIELKVKKSKAAEKGIVYVLQVFMDDGSYVVKVGIAARKYGKDHDNRLEKRVCEISSSFFKRYRYFPMVKVKKMTEVTGYWAMEARMHRELAEWKYSACHVFDGCEELFDVDVNRVVELYESMVDEYR